MREYKYRISRIIRLPLYVHCLALSQRRPSRIITSNECIRDANHPDIPSVSMLSPAVDKDTLLKHLTDLRRVESVVKEWMFTAKIVKSAIAIKSVGWNIDHLKLFDQIERWNSERHSAEQMKETQEALEEATKGKEEWHEAYEQAQRQKCDAQTDLRDCIIREGKLQEELDEANKQKDEIQKALDQAIKQNAEKQPALEEVAKQAREIAIRTIRYIRES